MSALPSTEDLARLGNAITPAPQAEDHGRLNPHVIRIEDTHGNVLWERSAQ